MLNKANTEISNNCVFMVKPPLPNRWVLGRKERLEERRVGWEGRSWVCKGWLAVNCLGVWLVEKRGKIDPFLKFLNGILRYRVASFDQEKG